MWKTVLDVVPPLLQAVSVAVTAYFAVIGLREWKKQLLGKRQIEVAERALLAAYKAKGAMRYIRNAMVFGGEGSTRSRDPGESEELARVKDMYFVHLKRIQETDTDFAELQKMRLLCQVYFGEAALTPFDAIMKARHKVAVSSRLLVDFAGEHGGDQALREQLKADVWEAYGSKGEPDQDPIVKSVAAAVTDIEAICRPYLKL